MTKVVTGTKFKNNKPFNGDKIPTPIFQPSKAMTPGKIIINKICGLDTLIVSMVGNEIYPVHVTISTMTSAVAVPNKQLNVEKRSADQPGNSFPPIVYTTQPITAMKINKDGIISVVAEKKAPRSPFVITKVAPIKATTTQESEKICGRFRYMIQTMTMEIIGITDSIIEATMTPGSPKRSSPQKIKML